MPGPVRLKAAGPMLQYRFADLAHRGPAARPWNVPRKLRPGRDLARWADKLRAKGIRKAKGS
jgi:hypothetical protein